jgi:hypothetical protein
MAFGSEYLEQAKVGQQTEARTCVEVEVRVVSISKARRWGSSCLIWIVVVQIVDALSKREREVDKRQ